MSTEKTKRGLGDNSINQEVRDNYKTWGEITDDCIKNILKLSNNISAIQDMHKASHGHEYYFADEQSNVKDCERYPATTPEFGNTRKCTPFEKKDFAGRANVELERSHLDALNIYGRLLDLKDKVKGGDNE